MTFEPAQNRELNLAEKFVNETDRHLFLTGKAGTGKTTFLHQLKKNTAKRMIVTAPTGVAAINAGGVTLHSFFQLPFGPFIPGGENTKQGRQRLFKFSKEKRRIIQNLDLLVIDEISMVRADLLDSVDAVLRRLRRKNRPFGGVQLLMIGDLHQLPPVAKHDEWQLLKQYYETVYFFSSHALDQTELVTIELNHIYRQTDTHFIHLLNQIRENRLEAASIKDLNQRHIENFVPEKSQGFINLTTHNNSADRINQSRLSALGGKEICFDAEVCGDFPEHSYPAPLHLRLKEGAQVMFLRNDNSVERRYYNGKIGHIRTIAGRQIYIRCPGESEDIAVDALEWENIKYRVDEDSKEIKEDVIGQFRQYPLKLAWAVTIHKSQGLTFDNAVIDVESAFAHGQVYVALSRCRTFEGIVLSSPINFRGIETDASVLRFINKSRQRPPSESRLQTAKVLYQQQMLLECFNLQLLQNRLGYLRRLLAGNASIVQISGVADMDQLQEMAQQQIFTVSEKFKQQLETIFINQSLPEFDAYTQERVGKASVWFQDKFGLIFDDLLQNLPIDTDNRELRKKTDNALKNLKREILVKLAGIRSCANGFSPPRYLRAISMAEDEFLSKKEKKTQAPVYSESDIQHPELFQQLKVWRSRMATRHGLAHFQVLHQKVLNQIVVNLPSSRTELKKIKGVGKKILEKYGEDILELVIEYRQQHKIDRVTLPEPKHDASNLVHEVKKDKNTRQISFDMHNKGLSIQRIAEKRGLAASTIYKHLRYFVENGSLNIQRLISLEKKKAIEAALSQSAEGSLKAVKEMLGHGYSYGDIKLVLAHRKHLTSK